MLERHGGKRRSKNESQKSGERALSEEQLLRSVLVCLVQIIRQHNTTQILLLNKADSMALASVRAVGREKSPVRTC
jgi:hypothetical protein